MSYSNQLFKALKINHTVSAELRAFATKSGLSISRLHYYNDNNILPSGNDLAAIKSVSGITELDLMLKMGRPNHSLLKAIQTNASQIKALVEENYNDHAFTSTKSDPVLAFETALGQMYQGDCIQIMKKMGSGSVDLIFADPPFNLDKLYPSEMDDDIRTETYLNWSEAWIKECVRILKPGGAFFIWNLPSWNSKLSQYLSGLLTFRHWIAVDIKYGMPIKNRLYPSHYSLLYYINGEKPNTFQADRMPMQTCPKCYGDLKDYGGHKHKMNPTGVSLTDVWLDIPPVRHAKHKTRGANELSIKLLDRIIEMASNEGDVIFDPFGGSGTTYVVAEAKNRKWIGSEIGPVDSIINRFKAIADVKTLIEKYRSNYNNLFPPGIKAQREKRHLWTSETVR